MAEPEDDGTRYQLFWGDLHNHNAVGYAKGSLERSIDIAREHLDFFAFTGQRLLALTCPKCRVIGT